MLGEGEGVEGRVVVGDVGPVRHTEIDDSGKEFAYLGADKSNLSFFKTSTFTLALLATQTFGQIVQNGGFESGK